MMHRSDRPVGNGDDVPSTSCADSGFASAEEEKLVAVLPPSTAYQDVTAPYFFLFY